MVSEKTGSEEVFLWIFVSKCVFLKGSGFSLLVVPVSLKSVENPWPLVLLVQNLWKICGKSVEYL